MQVRRRLGEPFLSSCVCGALLAGSIIVLSSLPGIAQQTYEGVPQVVVDGIARAGLHTPTNFRQRGPNFTANALTRTGAPVKIVIQSHSGTIIGYRVLTPATPPP